MRCFTVSNLNAWQGIRIVKDMYPYLAVSSGEKLPLGEDLIQKLHDCMKAKQSSDCGAFYWHPVLEEAFLMQASLELSKDGRGRLVSETGDSKERAFTLIEADWAEVGLDMKANPSYLGLHGSLAVRRTARWVQHMTLVRSSNPVYPAVVGVRLTAVLEPGQRISFHADWHRVDGRGMFRKDETPSRDLLEIEFKDGMLSLTDMRWYASACTFEVRERF